jgi:hypothetical protein
LPSKRRVETRLKQIAAEAAPPGAPARPVMLELLEIAKQEGLRVTKRAVKEGDYAGAIASAYVTWLAEQEQRKRTPTTEVGLVQSWVEQQQKRPPSA